jgi:pyruvate/2-oxoglutarate dehydrogenase complex dihydrolipoamide acyltransferase (E2) component
MFRSLLARGRVQPALWRYVHVTGLLRKDFKLTDIGEGIVQVEVMKWFVKPGDQVKEFDRLLEVQSDKATVEITSRFSGTVKRLAMKEGDVAKVGEVLVVFEDDGSSPPAKSAEPKSTPEGVPKVASTPSIEFIPSNVEKELDSGDDSQLNLDKVLATPAVRHLARENRIDLKRVKGSGKDGRIMKEDILAFVASKGAASAMTPQPSAPPEQKQQVIKPSTPSPPSAVPKAKGEVNVVPITGIRKEMGEFALAYVEQTQ